MARHGKMDAAKPNAATERKMPIVNAHKKPSREADKALLAAANLGDSSALISALEAGARVDSKNKVGLTAALLATFYGHEACLGTLIEAGADIDAKNSHGWTPQWSPPARPRRAA